MPTLRLLPELEEAIRQIPGVRAVSVVTSPEAEPTEVHVLASPGKPAKQLVRDVQSLALARYDIDIDHRIVSVVQIEDEPSAGGDQGDSTPTLPTGPGGEADADQPGPEPIRPAVEAISVRTSGPDAEAQVVLGFNGEAFHGAASGPAAAQHRPRLVAQATLAALGTLLGVPTEVDSATLVDAGGSVVALVVLTVSVPRVGPQSVSGSAVLRGDEADAVARAVLDALNRRLTG
jgi:hypothetical protein